MYVPPNYRNEDPAAVRAFVRQYGFATLVTEWEGRPWATHLPLELDHDETGAEILTGHMARANPQWRPFADGITGLAIFAGPHAYVSSSWYDHENVPTWNYLAVHVYGTLRVVTGERLLASLTKLVDRYEASSVRPVSVAGMSEKYLQSELRGLVGFEMTITDVQAAQKLSQNRDQTNHQTIVAELQRTGDAQAAAVADAMRAERQRRVPRG